MEIWAHRGASLEAPENTLIAFARALDQGADAIELDVRRTLDGVPVVIHDETVSRTTDGYGPVAAMTLPQIKRLDAGIRFGPAFLGTKVPTLEEVIHFAKPTRLTLNIELKGTSSQYPGFAEQVAAMVQAADLSDRVVVSAFDHGMLRILRRHPLGLRIALLSFDLNPVTPAYAHAFGADGVHPGLRTVSPAYMRDALRLGVDVRPYTIDAPRDITRLFSWGAHAVITNRPALAVRVLQGMRG